LPSETDVVFTTPSHQCPTAATMPMARRKELLDKAERDDFLIVEDDYEFEMSFLKPPSPALKSLDKNGRVIYVGSFSKSLFPGLRLGYVVGPAPFIREARALRASVLRHPPGHIQRTVTYFLSRGLADRSVLIEPGHSFFAGPTPPRNYYRLAYSSIAAPRITEGVALLAKTINEMK